MPLLDQADFPAFLVSYTMTEKVEMLMLRQNVFVQIMCRDILHQRMDILVIFTELFKEILKIFRGF